MTISKMAALGSSFAAGPNLEPVANRGAMRSAHNYPGLTAQILGASLVDATISGATTETILRKPQRAGFSHFPPQIESIEPALDFDLITITAGGNDLGYLGALLKAGVAHRLSKRAFTRPFKRALGTDGASVATPEQAEKATTGLIRIVEEVAQRAPRARILLVDYLTIIGPATRPSPSVPFSEEDLATFRKTSVLLAEAFQTAERESVATLISASTLSEDHAVDAAEPWVNGFRLGIRPAVIASCFHPNLAGMQAVSAAIVQQVGY